MTTRHRALVATFVTLSILAHTQGGRAQSQNACDPTTSRECADATAVGAAVEKALQNAGKTGLGGLRLQKAVLALETSANVRGGFVINFLIFTINHQTTSGQKIVQEITWNNLPAPAPTLKTAADLNEALSREIAVAAEVAASVKTLPLSGATITIKFVVDKDKGGGVSFQIFGVNLSGSVDVDKVSTNTLTVSFAKRP